MVLVLGMATGRAIHCIHNKGDAMNSELAACAERASIALIAALGFVIAHIADNICILLAILLFFVVGASVDEVV